MTPTPSQSAILEQLREYGDLTLGDLAKELGTTIRAARSDIDELRRLGKVVRLNPTYRRPGGLHNNTTRPKAAVYYRKVKT